MPDLFDVSKEVVFITGASAGFGIRATAEIGLSGNLGVAWPLTKPIATPLYGDAHYNPRLILQISQGF